MHHGRLPWFHPDELDADQRRLYDAIAGGPRAQGPQAFPLTDAEGRLNGPFNALLVAPEVGAAVQELGAALRYRTSLPDRVRELVILAVAAARRTSFEWYAHERVGRAKGLTEDELGHLRAHEAAPSFDSAERAAHRLATWLLARTAVDDDAHAEVVDALGHRGAQEVVTLVGYYELVGASLAFWRTPLPEGAEDPFADDAG